MDIFICVDSQQLQMWLARVVKLNAGRLLGRFLAASRARLREVAAKLGVRRLVNLAGCPAG